jgi:thiol-disulfide isomerase/thioredoxin/outer membrane lipoprotein-sorting protein
MWIRMTHRRIAVWMVIAMGALCMQGGITARAQDKAPTDPTEFLKWSMARYAALTNFQADCYWSDSFNSTQKMMAKRTLVLAKPNHYKVVYREIGSRYAARMTAVCDGKLAVEYSDVAETAAMKDPVPRTLAVAGSVMMQNPSLCGTLLYHFFDGPEKLADLADTTKQEIAFGRDVTIEGRSYKTVTFYARGIFGKTAVAISAEDGLVHRIRYDSAPLMEKMAGSEFGKQAGVGTLSSESEEDYVNIVTNSVLPASTFDTTLPKGTKLMDPAAKEQDEEEPKPPVPLGKRAPNFTVKTLAGEKRSLTDFRGKVVLIDFWATWCPPCRKGLPETQAFAKKYGKRGLAVLAISDEDAKTVSPFIKSNHYTFPTYLDADSKMSTRYKIEAIPTVVILDKTGHLVAYMVGLQDPADIKAKLKKAGLKLN